MTPEDVLPYLGGVTPPAESVIQDAIDAAILELEIRTGRIPFLAEDEESETTFDPPDGLSGRWLLDLEGYASISDVTSEGKAEVYFEVPGKPNRPIDAIEFVDGVSQKRRSVVITGVRGSYATFPPDVKTGLCKLTAANLIEMGIGASGPIKSEEVGDRSVSYGTPSTPGEVSSLSESYRKDFDRVVNRYKRIPRNP